MKRRLTAEMLEKKEYYQMPKWIYGIKGLKPVDREIYMIGLNNWRLSVKNQWVNEKGEVFFKISQGKVASLLYISRRTVMRSIEKLVEVGLLEVEISKNGSAHDYYMIDIDIEDIELRTLSNVEYYDEKKSENPCKNGTGDKTTLVTKLHGSPVTELHGEPVTKLHESKNYTKNYTKKEVVAEEKPATANFDTFKKSLKAVLPDSLQDMNANTIKNIYNYSEGKIEEVRETILYMATNGKDMVANILVAILKDGDYKSKPDSINKVMTREDKINYMIEHTSENEVEQLRENIRVSMELEGEYLEVHLGNILCQRYNQLQS